MRRASSSAFAGCPWAIRISTSRPEAIRSSGCFRAACAAEPRPRRTPCRPRRARPAAADRRESRAPPPAGGGRCPSRAPARSCGRRPGRAAAVPGRCRAPCAGPGAGRRWRRRTCFRRSAGRSGAAAHSASSGASTRIFSIMARPSSSLPPRMSMAATRLRAASPSALFGARSPRRGSTLRASVGRSAIS